MSSWTGLPLRIELVPRPGPDEQALPSTAGKRQIWRVLRETSFASSYGLVVVPEGWLTDGTSWPFKEGRQAPASVVHDCVYARGWALGPDEEGEAVRHWMTRYPITRREGDRIYREALESLGDEDGEPDVPAWKRRVLYLGVRLCGRRAWRRYRARDLEEQT